jgi:hypothetical protein
MNPVCTGDYFTWRFGITYKNDYNKYNSSRQSITVQQELLTLNRQ